MQSISNNAAPIYHTIGVPEIDSNPLLAHLRLPPETDDDAFLALGLRPDFDANERMLPTSIRRLRINRLRRFFVPTLPVHRRALIEICSQLFDGYMARNPMTPHGQSILYGGPVDLPYRPTISLVAGHSGMGKSTLLDRILAYLGNQVRRHTVFRGIDFPETQILWLRRNMPEQCTVGTLCSSFGDYTDRVLRMSLYGGIFGKLKGGDRNLYLSEIRKIITTHHVGLLVLDEFQNLSLMGVGAKKIIALLVNLRDELGLPIVVVGTYKALRLLEGNLSTARRLVEGGYFDLERPISADDENWWELCGIAWEYQWVREPIEFSSDICQALYDVSQGITGIMINVFAASQLAAMEDGLERIDADLIRKVFKERMQPLHPAIRILQSGDPRLMDKFDDIYKDLYPGQDRGDDGENASASVDGQHDGPPADADATESQPAKKRSKSSPRTPAAKPLLSEEQIRKLVMSDSVANLISVLDKT